MLIQGLKELEKDGVVKRKDFREVPPRVEYSLAERGVELANVLRPLCEWGTANFNDQIAAPQLETYGRQRSATPRAPLWPNNEAHTPGVRKL
jgi:DNA-binding HxlR family transcriptional regulator